MTVAQGIRAYLNSRVRIQSSRVIPASQWQVYFIGCRGLPYVKIGKAVSPRQRLRDLQSGCPVELFIMATTKDFTEDILHKRFDHSRVRGEWFKLDWELQNFINQLPGS